MKILHVIPTYYPATYWGGPMFSVYALNNALARLPEVSLKVLTTDAAGPQLRQRLDRSCLQGLYPNQEIIMARRVAAAGVSFELLQKLPGLIRQADVVHLTAAYSFPTIPTLLLCRIFNKPLVWSPRGAIQDAHEWEGAKRRRLKRWWERICNMLIRPGEVVAHTTAERERGAMQERIPSANAIVVPNGVEVPSKITERYWQPAGLLRLMYIGRLSSKKGIENLLEAVAQLKGRGVTLRIYGSGDAGYASQLKLRADQLGLSAGMVSFAGHVDGDAKVAAFANADVCIVPSYTENFCMVIAESLAHGVPVIASHGTPWAEVEKRRCGLWVDNSPATLAHAITRIRVMDLPEMGERGKDWMKEEYDWDRIALAIHNVYRNVL